MLSKISISSIETKTIKLKSDKEESSSDDCQKSLATGQESSTAYAEKEELNSSNISSFLANRGIKINSYTTEKATQTNETEISESEAISKMNSIEREMKQLDDEIEELINSGETPQTIFFKLSSAINKLHEFGGIVEKFNNVSGDAEKTREKLEKLCKKIKSKNLEYAAKKKYYESFSNPATGFEKAISSKTLIEQVQTINENIEQTTTKILSKSFDKTNTDQMKQQIENFSNTISSIYASFSAQVKLAAATLSNEAKEQIESTEKKFETAEKALDKVKKDNIPEKEL